ncbi:hypothetical protein ECSTECDG1313_1728 [Escherichia coli STEC_DG131-3]|nr:hypothetical protein ECSTECDG1313_1728 [Escherichia coli STEC_DG131-3]
MSGKPGMRSAARESRTDWSIDINTWQPGRLQVSDKDTF